MTSRRLEGGMILLVMSLLMAMITLMAASSARLASLQGRSSDGFRNHLQALHAAEIALAHCEEIGSARPRGSLPATSPQKMEGRDGGHSSFDADLTPMSSVVASTSWQDIARWQKYAPELIEVSMPGAALPVPPQCVIDELAAPHRLLVTARGFSANYSRAANDMAGAEVWLQSVTVPSTSITASSRAPLHSWRQLISPPH